ncbi:Ger(x)C family spore germination protein [Schinkia azotoformans]|uniref:Ger(x)C family spore germination protein n=1 Tax=Schinkia azotoformans TaxID=1454 RepID=UPI002DBB9408|nr:Ger(x)C family spore germination protein [Schinkia azotoformans]MEC1720129.1 Ger(x)C family spore germination protein [Schinkia azotoformans]MED4354040.1 Ger(x)C family spore germination protein [Schinkia azotoformans]MED4414156.1 Ger(x)C family spore germination protein [Schinkia azotoformans]
MRRYFKGLLLLSLLVLLVLISSGCGFKDIDKRFFVVGIGIDSIKNEEEQYLVSLKLAIPASDLSTGKNEFIIVSEKAKTITEAVRIIKSKVDKELEFSHAKIIIYGEELIKNDMPGHLVYWFIRRRDIQQIAYMSIGKPTALDVLKVKPKSERLPSNAMFLAFGKTGTETPYTITAPLFEFQRRIIERGQDPYLPIIEADKDLLEINKLGIMDKRKLIHTLSPDETELFNLLTGNVPKFELKVSKDDLYFLIFGKKVNSKYIIHTPTGNKPYITVQIDINGTMEEALFNISMKDIPKYEKAAKEDLENRIKDFLVSLQKANLDPIGFGLRYRSRHFNNKTEWEMWQSIYPEIEFRVKANVKIEGVGIIE